METSALRRRVVTENTVTTISSRHRPTAVFDADPPLPDVGGRSMVPDGHWSSFSVDEAEAEETEDPRGGCSRRTLQTLGLSTCTEAESRIAHGPSQIRRTASTSSPGGSA